MTLEAASQMELIPGYRLLSRLGHGGFGEVWKAEAPGGLLKAVKIVYGSIHGAEAGDAPARQELKALERVKAVRHPYILSLERYDIVNGQLVIVTELADKNLWDRFHECRAQGLAGIPRDELLRHMEEAAEALDLMNIECQLQHLDIKPQNLFLVYNHVKVADFGLVKDLAGMRTQMTSGITAGYAPPETFEGLVSPYCDQYSLAVVYQELLTGRLPFEGSNPRQLMMQHLTAEPNLDPLPPEDRAAVARALAKKPEDRHPSCGTLVRALRGGAVDTPLATSRSRSSQTPAPPAQPSPSPRPSPATPRAENVQILLNVSAEVPTEFMGPARPAPSPASPVVIAVAPEPVLPERPEITGDGLLFPAVVIGLGSAGREALSCLRKGMCKRWGAAGLQNVRLLLLDADPDELSQATQGDADTALRGGETYLARLQRPSQYLKHGRQRQTLEKWLDLDLLSLLPRDQTTPNGWRPLGRMAFANHAAAIASRLATELEAATDDKTLAAAAKQTGLGLRTNRPRVYIITSLGGGTGGGMLLDVAYAARQRLQQMGYRQPGVVGLFLLPAVQRAGDKARSTANAFAALTELSYFSAPRTVFSASYDQGQAVVDPAPPFSRCVLLPLPREEEPASLHELANLTGEFLVRELATPLAKVADQERSRRAESGGPGRAPDQAESPSPGTPTRAAPGTAPKGLVCQTFGAYWFAVPRRLLLQRVAQCLCHRLVQSWRADNATGLQEKVQAWIAEQLAQCHLTPDQLSTQLTEQSTQILERSPDEEVGAALAVFGKGQPSDLGRNPALAAGAIAAVEQLVGAPTGDAGKASAALGDILAQAMPALASRLEERLAELALRVLAEPHFRLLGVEDMVQGRLSDALAAEAQTQSTEAAKLTRQAAGLCPPMKPVLDALQRGSLWGWGQKDRQAAQLLRLLRGYGMARWQALIRQALSVLYQDLQDNLHNYYRKVGCCRSRIVAFLKHFEDSAAGKANVDLGLGQYLLPAGCRTLAEAVEQILASLTGEELEEINLRVQSLIGRAFKGQVHVCTAPADFFKELEEEVLREVAAFAEAPLGRAHAAQMYLAQRGQDAATVDELAGAFHEAAPELAGSRLAPEDELNILAVPPGPEGEYFRSLVQQALPDQTLVSAPSTDDIVFYREVQALSLTALPQMGPVAAEVYRQFLAGNQLTPHSRTDITDWLRTDETSGHP
jgi:serine/threonine protein kinase